MKKALSLILCMALVATMAVMGTLAYLTDRSTVENTFTVGNVDITVDEEKVNPDGTPTPEDDDRVTENEYHLIPGQTYTKDPTMTVKAGSEKSYVRMLVTVNNYEELKAIQAELAATYPDKAAQFILLNYVKSENSGSANWKLVGKTENADNTATYEFRYNEIVDASGLTEDLVLPPLFESITVPGEVNAEQLATLVDFKLTAEGHAIQVAGFVADEENNLTAEDVAWAAFDAQFAAENP